MTNTIDINEVTLKAFIETIRPKNPDIRKQIDFAYSYDGKTAILYQITPKWDDPEDLLQMEFAKMRYYKSRQEWNVYWMRANGKWELYEPFPEATHLEDILQVIKEDKHACFFG
jgi:hypothetical protein